MSSNLEVIRAHYAASDRGDLDGMLAPLAPDCAWTEMAGFPYAGTYRGPDEVRKGVFERIGAEWDGYRLDLEELLDAGEVIVGVGAYHGTFRATGRSMTARVVHLWRLRAGQVIGFEQLTDTLRVAEALRR